MYDTRYTDMVETGKSKDSNKIKIELQRHHQNLLLWIKKLKSQKQVREEKVLKGFKLKMVVELNRL